MCHFTYEIIYHADHPKVLVNLKIDEAAFVADAKLERCVAVLMDGAEDPRLLADSGYKIQSEFDTYTLAAFHVSTSCH